VNLPDGAVFIPPEKHIASVSNYSREVIEEFFEFEDISGVGVWICASYKTSEPQIISQIPPEILNDADMRKLTFGEVVPQMIRESEGKAFSFIVPMMFSTPVVQNQFAIRVLAFNGFQFVDFYLAGEIDDEFVFTSYREWGRSTGTGGVGSALIENSQRALYLHG
jgi:hypothetical protein